MAARSAKARAARDDQLGSFGTRAGLPSSSDWTSSRGSDGVVNDNHACDPVNIMIRIAAISPLRPHTAARPER